MGRKTRILTQPGLLLCEGEDEVNFFTAWFADLGLDHVEAIAYQGKTWLQHFLADLPKLQGAVQLRRLAILRDADEDAVSAESSVRSALAQAPELIRKLQPAVFILPGGGRKGALEALWLESLAADPKAACVEGFFDCIQSKDWAPSDVFAKNDKARAQLWIAMKDIPNERFGIAAWHGRRDQDKPWMKEPWVDFSHPAFAGLREFLLRAFSRSQGTA